MGILIKDARFIITPTNKGDLRILEHKDLLIEDDKITCISGECRASNINYVIDGSRHVLLPGLIDAHTHLDTMILYGLMPDRGYEGFYEELKGLLDRIPLDIVRDSIKLSCLKMIMNGVIGFIDMSRHYSIVRDECSPLGLYVRTGPVNPDIRLAGKYIRESMYEGFKPVINITDLSSISDDYLSSIKELIRDRRVYVNVHVSEIRREVYYVKREKGYLPVEYLYRIGFLDDKTIISHANWVTSGEIEYLAEKNSMVTVSPHTTMRLAEEGFTPVYEIMSRNIPLAVGSNGVTGDKYNLIEEFRELILLYRQNYWDTRLGIRWSFPRLIRNMYVIAGVPGGVVEVGGKANIALYRLDDILHRPVTRSNILSIILLTGGLRAEATIINGRLIYHPGVSDKLLIEHNRLSKRIEEYLRDNIDLYNGVLIG